MGKLTTNRRATEQQEQASANRKQEKQAIAAELAAQAELAEQASLAAQTAQTAEALAEQEQEQTAEREKRVDAANKKLKQAAQLVKGAERGLRDGYFRAAPLVWDFVTEMRRLKHSRESAINKAKYELELWSSSSIDIVRMMKAYFAHKLAVADQGAKIDLPYGHYYLGFSNLVISVDSIEADETFVLLPGAESKCIDLVRECAANSWNRKDTTAHVDTLVLAWNQDQAAALKAERDQAAAQLAAQKQEAQKLEQERKAAEQAAAQAEKQAQTDLNESTKKNAEKAKAELLQKQRAEIEKQAEIDAMERAQSAGDKQLERVESAVKRIQSKGDRKDKGKGGKRENLLPADKTDATPEQWADSAMEFILQHDEPENVLFALLSRLKTHEELSRPGQRAIQAALTTYNRNEAIATS